jgi:hypothetical protein
MVGSTSSDSGHPDHRKLLDGARDRRAVAAVRRGRLPETRVSPTQARHLLTRLRRRGLSIGQIAEITAAARSCPGMLSMSYWVSRVRPTLRLYEQTFASVNRRTVARQRLKTGSSAIELTFVSAA